MKPLLTILPLFFLLGNYVQAQAESIKPVNRLFHIHLENDECQKLDFEVLVAENKFTLHWNEPHVDVAGEIKPSDPGSLLVQLKVQVRIQKKVGHHTQNEIIVFESSVVLKEGQQLTTFKQGKWQFGIGYEVPKG